MGARLVTAHVRLALVIIAVGVTLAACADTGGPRPSGGGYTIAAAAGSRQAGTVGEGLPISPAVKVTDPSGNPAPGVVVTFSIDSGGGSLSDTTPTTDAQGRAAVGQWILGTTAGRNSLRATATGVTGRQVLFVATGTAGPPRALSSWQGDGQVVKPGRAVPVRPAVRVTDTYGNPVAGVQVTFTVTAGQGQVVGALATTGYTGVATVGGWTIGSTPGVNTLSATAAALIGLPVSFNVTGVLNPTDIIVLVRDSYFRSDQNGEGASGYFGDWPIDSIPAGGRVVWVWEGHRHNVTSLNGYWGDPFPFASSGNLSAPSTFGPLQFNTSGLYYYRCSNHSTFDYDWGYRGMLGRIRVLPP